MELLAGPRRHEVGRTDHQPLSWQHRRMLLEHVRAEGRAQLLRQRGGSLPACRQASILDRLCLQIVGAAFLIVGANTLRFWTVVELWRLPEHDQAILRRIAETSEIGCQRGVSITDLALHSDGV